MSSKCTPNMLGIEFCVEKIEFKKEGGTDVWFVFCCLPHGKFVWLYSERGHPVVLFVYIFRLVCPFFGSLRLLLGEISAPGFGAAITRFGKVALVLG